MNPFKTGFRVEYKGIDIFQEKTLHSGFTVGNPILDWALTAIEWGYKWEEFTDLPGEDQAFLVAVFRTKRQIEAVSNYQQYKRMRRKRGS